MRRKQMKRRLCVLLTLSLLCSCVAAGCGSTESSDEIVLRVANWEEYIDEGDWDEEERIDLENGASILGEHSMVDDFEEWYYETYGKRVRVEYSTFGTNEDLYNQMTLGDTFDLVCPSEYMIMKLMREGEVLPFSEDFYREDLEENYYARGVSPYIRERLENLEIDGESLADYAAGYMWGVIGYVYNPEYISRQEAEDWNLLRNSDYYKRVTTKDSIRDSYFAAAGMLYQDEMLSEEFMAREDYAEALDRMMNDTSPETVDKIEKLLTQVKDNAYSFETDSGKADLVTGKVVANLQWSGDGVYSMQQAEEDGVQLEFAVPASCTNLWFDGWCMLKDGIGEDQEKQQAAEAFVNFLSRPDNAVRNMYYIGYTSVISGGEDDTIFDYADWCYGAELSEDELPEEDDAAAAGDVTDEEMTTAAMEDAGLVEYPLGYFFGADAEDPAYTILAEESMAAGQLYAQYPTEDVLDRSVVMACFDDEANERINRMWINVRCFGLW